MIQIQPPATRGQKFQALLLKAWRGLVALDFISNFFTWIMEAIARFAEHFASGSAIYIIIVAGVPVLFNEQLHTIALAIIIGSPELLVVGAFKIASREVSRGNRKGWLLMAACLVLLFLTFLTVGDLFMWHWDAAAMNVLMGFRCLAGIAYSFTRGIVTGESEPSVGEQVNLLRVWFTEAMDEVNRVNSETRDLVHSAMNQMNHRGDELLTEVRKLSQSMTRVNQETGQALETALEELSHQSELILDSALERLEHASSQRLHAVYTRLEQVTVTLEQSQVLPAVPAPSTRLLSRRTSEPRQVPIASTVAGKPTPINQEEQVNQQSELPDSSQGCDSKVNLGRGFTVNHFRQAGSLPSLALIMSHAQCSKTLASRAYNLAKADLGLK